VWLKNFKFTWPSENTLSMLTPSQEPYSRIIGTKTPGSPPATADEPLISPVTGKKKNQLRIGQSTVIFKVSQNNRSYAISCFVDAEPEIIDRYRQLETFLAKKQFSWKINFQLLEKTAWVSDEHFPVLQTDWTEALSLSDYIDTISNHTAALSQLQQLLVQLSGELEKEGIAHGNLNNRHIRVNLMAGVPFLQLLDYDAMYIPPFQGKQSLYTGTPGFQHPMRLASDFNETIDRFSFWILLAGLEAIKTDPLLWSDAAARGFDKSEQLLFTYRDLAFPEHSGMFNTLASYKNPALSYYVEKLISFCSYHGLDAIEEPHIYNKKTAEAKQNFTSGLPDPFIPETGSSGNKNISGSGKAGARKPDPATSTQDSVEIEYFTAGRHIVDEGEQVTLSWKVNGAEKIHISGIGFLQKPSGTRQMALRHTTDFILTAGNHTRSLTIQVKPRSRPRVAHLVKEQPWLLTFLIRKKLYIGIALILILAAYFIFAGISAKKDSPEITPLSAPVSGETKGPELKSPFSETAVKSFLSGLYQSYNKRDLPAILGYYDDKVQEYYDARSLNRDSLSAIINDLFISPSYYECQPDLKTLQFSEEGQVGTIQVTIIEKLRANQQSPFESFTSRVEYKVNPSLKIISERKIN
jgi:hypothetical protein